jgi:hypothetical protein
MGAHQLDGCKCQCLSASQVSVSFCFTLDACTCFKLDAWSESPRCTCSVSFNWMGARDKCMRAVSFSFRAGAQSRSTQVGKCVCVCVCVGKCPVSASRCVLAGMDRVRSRRMTRMRRSPSRNRSAHEPQRRSYLATTLWSVEVTEAGQRDALALHTRGRARRVRTIKTWFWVGNMALWHSDTMVL